MRAAGRELLDGPVESLDELEENFRDIERANRYLGSAASMQCAVLAFRPSTLLDAGSGSADIPRAIAIAAERRGCDLQITCLDSSPAVVDLARRRNGHPALRFVVGDGTSLPFPDRSFDVAMCSLTLHHCDPPQAVRLLAELRRVARVGVVIGDLRRSRFAWIGALLLSRLCTHNRLSRNDAPLSTMRAYTPSEALDLARRAGWRDARVRKTPFFRMLLTDG